jgi:hypothetical protein
MSNESSDNVCECRCAEATLAYRNCFRGDLKEGLIFRSAAYDSDLLVVIFGLKL